MTIRIVLILIISKGLKLNRKKDIARYRKYPEWEKGEYDLRKELIHTLTLVLRPHAEIEARIKNGSIKTESTFAVQFINSIKSSHGKNLLWLCEMFLGKPKQLVDDEQIKEQISLLVDKGELDL